MTTQAEEIRLRRLGDVVWNYLALRDPDEVAGWLSRAFSQLRSAQRDAKESPSPRSAPAGDGVSDEDVRRAYGEYKSLEWGTLDEEGRGPESEDYDIHATALRRVLEDFARRRQQSAGLPIADGAAELRARRADRADEAVVDLITELRQVRGLVTEDDPDLCRQAADFFDEEGRAHGMTANPFTSDLRSLASRLDRVCSSAAAAEPQGHRILVDYFPATPPTPAIEDVSREN